MSRQQRQTNSVRNNTRPIRSHIYYTGCVEDYMTPDQHLEYLDRKLYEQSNRY